MSPGVSRHIGTGGTSGSGAGFAGIEHGFAVGDASGVDGETFACPCDTVKKHWHRAARWLELRRLRVEPEVEAALVAVRRGPKVNPATAQKRRDAQLNREIVRLSRQLARANAIIEVQKKLCSLLGLPTAEEQESKD